MIMALDVTNNLEGVARAVNPRPGGVVSSHASRRAGAGDAGRRHEDAHQTTDGGDRR
jgi:hypothetical protein